MKIVLHAESVAQVLQIEGEKGSNAKRRGEERTKMMSRLNEVHTSTEGQAKAEAEAEAEARAHAPRR